MNLSAIVITKNEERVIGRCLASLAFCDEILLVDSGSTDRTLAIAREHGAQVMNEDWRGPATQRNRGLARAQGRWCLLLDADEWVPPPLRDEIVALLAAERAAPRRESAFRIPRSSSYCGQFMRHGGWWPDPVTRLLRRGAARFDGGIVHEHPVVDGAVGELTQPLMHESFRDLEQVLGKVNAYSTWGAQTLRDQGKSPGLASAVAHGLWTFLRTYVVKAGFLDGRRGFMLAVSNAEGAYYKYVKAMLMAQAGAPSSAVTATAPPAPATRADAPEARE
ncbi:MAG: glycosyltransferase family 2 protein [Burkholderiaceae bacterium]|jgi:glycosyltransferase involved in cell wall biosynthesis|nr:glycosyltransferase family 2 protein [Burkholderiaceae bacterium]